MSEQERIILQYLENSYTGARMLDDISAMTRIARAIEAFEAEPTEDIFAVEPKKGKWETEYDTHTKMLACSACGGRVLYSAYTSAVGTKGYAYCPYCGARMEE